METWLDDKVSIEKLSLDLQNPRVPEHIKDKKDESLIRNYLLKKEDVLRIARNITNNGYHKSAIAITCKENDKLVVLDGNRRLAACQFLLNPKLALEQRYITEFERLSNILDKEQLKQVKIVIAPSRKEAEKEIWDIHVNQLLKQWQPLQKIRMYRNLINSGEYTIETASAEYGITKSKFGKELSRLYFYEKILGNLKNSEEEKELLKSGFNKIDRLVLSSNGKKLLKYNIDEKGKIILENKKDFDIKIKKLIPFIINHSEINAQITQDELNDKVFNKIDPSNFPKNSNQQKLSTKPDTFKKSNKDEPGTLSKGDWITRKEYLSYNVGSDKVKYLLEELSKTDPNLSKVMSVISLRILIESAIYHKLQDKKYIAKMIVKHRADLKAENLKRIAKGGVAVVEKENWAPTLRNMLDYITIESHNVIKDPQAREALSKKIKGETNFVVDLNSFIHNVHSIPVKGEAEKIWCGFGRFIFEIIKNIK